MKKYTVAFIFDKDLKEVLLIKKKRPAWQAGKFNGPGGRMEEGESSYECVAREIDEECGLVTSPDDWKLFARLSETSKEATVDFYTLQYNGNLDDIKQLTDEAISWHSVRSLPENVIPNVVWLVPLALNGLADEALQPVTIEYK